MKTYICFLLLFFFPFFAISQDKTESLKGKVVDSNNNPIPFVNVLLYSLPDSTFIEGVTTKDSGEFEFSNTLHVKEGFLEISHIAYKTEKITIGTKHYLLVRLKDDDISIGDVVVVGKKKAIEFHNGNLVANVSAIPNSQSYNISQLLKRLPGVVVNEREGISLGGTTAVVYIDGRKQHLSGQALLRMLEALPATSIEKVELNSIADGSQSASDSQAIINLKTNNKKLDGYYFSLGGELSHFEQGKQGGASNVFYMFKKGNILFNTSLSYSHDYDLSYTKDSTYYRNNSIMLNESEDFGRTNIYVLNSNLAWEFKEGHLLNFNAFIYDDFSNKKSTQHIRTYNTLGNADYFLDMKGDGNDDLWSGSIEYSSPDTLSNRIVARYEFDYGGLRDKRDYYRRQLPSDKQNNYYYTNPEMVGYRHIGKIDFTHKDSIYGNFKAGVKATMGHLDDDVITEAGKKHTTSNFTGEEKIVEGYVRYLYDITPKLGMNVAFRAERTNYDTDFNSGTDGINRTYANYFPYFHLYYNLSESYQTVLAYVSSINRPNYEHMLPGVRFQNDFSYTQGNPNLEPTLIRGIIWGHYLYGYGNVMFRYVIDKNIEGPVLVDETGKVRKYTYENYADNDRFQVNAYLPFEFFQKKLSGYLQGYIRHNSLKNIKKEYLVSKERNKYWQGNFQTMLNYQITESLGVNLWSSFTPSYKGFQYDYESNWAMDLGMTYSFLKNDSGVISLSIEDIFNTYNNDRKYYYDGNILDKQISYKDSRFIKLGLRISLNGGEKIRDKAKENINDTSRFR